MLLQEGTGRYFRFRSRPWRGTPFSHYRMQARTLTDFTDENEYSKVQQIPWASRKSASRHHRRRRRRLPFPQECGRIMDAVKLEQAKAVAVGVGVARNKGRHSQVV